MQLDQLELDAINRLANELLLMSFDKVKEIYHDICRANGQWKYEYEHKVLTARKEMIEDLVRRYKGIIW